MADLRFASHAQPAIGRALDRADDGAGGPLVPAAFHPPLAVTHPDGATRPLDGTPGFGLAGPGSVTGLDQRCFLRHDPPLGAGEAESNYLASIELRPVELPWLFTPARPSGGGRLRPWIVLVVVEAEATTIQPGRPLPRIDVAVAELPDLRESWAWAHVQAPPPGATPPAGITGLDGQAVARLVCPRRLAPRTRYRACIVPAFRGGREAGLTGDAVDPATELAPAWDVARDERALLPVYYVWDFGTGEEGDFEQLVRRLGPAPADRVAGLGSRMVDIGAPWPDVTLTAEPATVPVPGALRALGDVSPGTASEATADALADELVEQLTSGGLTPPLYGGRHVVRDTVSAPPEDWLGELNLTAARRIAAGVGAAYVRAHQEELMARAWERAGAIREANRRRALGELAESVGESVHRRHVAPLQAGEVVLLAAPAAVRTATAPSLTLSGEVAVSTLPDAAASAAFSRFANRRSVLLRTFTRPADVVERAASGEASPPAAQPLLGRLRVGVTPPGAAPGFAAVALTAASSGESRVAAGDVVVLDTLARAARANGLAADADRLSDQVAAVGVAPSMLLSGQLAAVGAALATRLSDAAQLLRAVRRNVLAVPRVQPGEAGLTEFGLQLDVPGLRDRLLQSLDPSPAVRARLDAAISVPGGMTAPPTLDEPVMLHPTFPPPMALALADFAPAWLLPGIGGVPSESCVLLRPDAGFVESFLVGLAHELSNEMRWREYPTDLRGTPFARFWPRPGGADDIPPIHTWTGALGSHLAGGAEDLAVLLVRGSVVRRFPDMVVAAAPAVDARTAVLDPAQWQPPVFVLRIDEQTAAYAFRHPDPDSLTLDPAVAPGLFFAFQEHTYRIRFGFDLPGTTPDFRVWPDLDWGGVPQQRGFALADRDLAPPPDDTTGARWRRDAADIARITLQRPFRVLVHSHALVGGR